MSASPPMHGSAIRHHRGADGDDIGLEQIGGHAGAVADIVADVVGDHGRVAGIVLGDSGLDLADQVGADVGGLGEDAAAETGEDRNQRGAEAPGRSSASITVRSFGRVAAGTASGTRRSTEIASRPRPATSMPVIAPGAEGDGQAALQAGAGGFGGAHVGAHRNVHADEAGRRPTAARRCRKPIARQPPRGR